MSERGFVGMESGPQRPQLARLHRILRRVAKGDYPNRRVLAEELEIDERTVQRDLDFLRDFWRVPLEYDRKRFGYWFTEGVSEFPLLPISEGELVSVFVAQKALAQYRGTPFEGPLRSAFEKLVNSLEGEMSVAWADLDGAISFRGMQVEIADAELFQHLSGAVRKMREVEFEYRKLRAGGEAARGDRASGGGYERRRVRPYHLACVGSQWYLFGFDLARKDTRTFALSRMRGLEVTEMVFEKPKDFSAEEMLGGSFGVFAGKELKRIRVRFDAWAAQLVRERQWHHSQKLRELPGGEMELELRLSSMVEVVPWILSWGEHARAIAPEELVKEVKGKVEKMGEVYRV